MSTARSPRALLTPLTPALLTALAADARNVLDEAALLLERYELAPVPPFEAKRADVRIARALAAGVRTTLAQPGMSFADAHTREITINALTEVMILTAHATRANGHGCPEWYRTGAGAELHERIVRALGQCWAVDDTLRAEPAEPAAPARPTQPARARR